MKPIQYGIALFFIIFTITSCNYNSTGTNQNEDTGALNVVINTIGSNEDFDEDGYKLKIGSQTQDVNIQDEVLIEDLSEGIYEIVLTDLQSNCEITNEIPIEVKITAAQTVNKDIQIKCYGILKDKIVYITGKPLSNRELISMGPDGSNKKVISNEPKRFESLVFSSDGTKIAYDYEDGIHVVSSKTYESIYRFGGNYDYSPVFSPDGTSILYTSGLGNDSRIYKLDLNEGWPSSRLLSVVEHEYETHNTPTFSSDGSLIAFTGRIRNQDPIQNNIFILSTNENSLPTKFTDTGNNRNPVFAGDGDRIVFQSSIDQENMDLKVVSIDDKIITNLTNSEEFNEHSPRVSPDGINVAYIQSKPNTNGSAESAIFLINLEDPGNVIRLTEFTTGLINLGNFSPDGNYIVYVKTDSERQQFDEREIYKVDISGTNNPIQLTNNSTSDTDPKWSPVK
ncbi:MAG: hypothetical protein RI573_01850 [Balneolaceae bacterium]|nr:hypothetical protein [Balneolaceae bacterium]